MAGNFRVLAKLKTQLFPFELDEIQVARNIVGKHHSSVEDTVPSVEGCHRHTNLNCGWYFEFHILVPRCVVELDFANNCSVLV